MSKLKVFPVDLLGTAPSNKVVGEVRTIQRNEDRIFIPTGGPFYSKSLKVWSGAVQLIEGVDYRAKELNRNATVDSGKEVCNAIHIKNIGTTFTLEYQVIGGHYTELGEELADFIVGTPLEDLTKIHWTKVLYKPLTYPPSPHTHVATDWRGYGDSIYLVEQLHAQLIRPRTKSYDAGYAYIDQTVEDATQTWVDANGVIVTDQTPTAKGNVLLTGNGTEPNKLKMDLDAIYKELDERYFRNNINPLTRIGQISDTFLPLTTGFFNVVSPLIPGRHSTAVAKVERNGDLLALTPASDGEYLRYVYGYSREYSKTHNIGNYKATNQQYRPQGLLPNEEIMELQGINNQTMIATIFTVASDGISTFKEHAIVVLNDTLLQDSHVLIRVGSEIMTILDISNVASLRSYSPSFCRTRNGTYYFVSLTSGRLLNPTVARLSSDLKLTIINTWASFKETKTVQHRDGLSDLVLSTAKVAIPNQMAGVVSPFSWFKSDATVGQYWILDNTLALPGYNLLEEIYNQGLVTHVVGNEIHVMTSLAAIAYLTEDGYGLRQNLDAVAGASFRIDPTKATPEYTWVRTKSIEEEPSTYLVNAEQGFYRQLDDDPSRFEYRVPYDMAANGHLINGVAYSSCIHLADGGLMNWAPPPTTGGQAYLSDAKIDRDLHTPVELMNGYNFNRNWRLNSGVRFNATADLINLENPTIIPLVSGAIPLNDRLVLVQAGSAAYSGGPVSCLQYVYRPNASVITYKTQDLGAVNGYATSDDRKLLEGETTPILFVNSRLANGTCRYSNMAFLRQPLPFVNQVVYRSVRLNYNAATIERTIPYTLTLGGFNAIEFAIDSIMEANRDVNKTSWGLIISPEDPTIALFDCQAANAVGLGATAIRCAAKLTWNISNELTSIVLRPEPGQVTTSEMNVTGVRPMTAANWYSDWAIQYENPPSVSYWHGRLPSGLAYPGNTNSSSAIFSYKMTIGGDGFPVLEHMSAIGGVDGGCMVVATPAGVGVNFSNLAYGVYRIFRPFLNGSYVSGVPWSMDSAQAFVWYNPRPTVSFKIRVTEDFNIQLGGVYSKVLAGEYSLTDPLLSNVIDARNKTINVYVQLDRGEAKLYFSEISLPESIYSVFIGTCITDQYGIVQADILPVSRIANYRSSVSPRGSSFSASSGTANQELLLNWDADIPATLVSERVRGFINGADNLNQGASIVLAAVVTPEDTVVVSRVWTSLDTSIATVDQNGVVKGIRAGQVTIKCLINDEVTATKNVTIAEVKKVEVPITGNTSVDGAWKIIPSVDLLDTFRKYTGRDPKTGEEVNFTVPAGYAVIANSTAVPAINVNNWPEFTILTMAVDGAVVGRGGQGARVNPGGSSVINIKISVIAHATPGGAAIKSDNTPLHIVNKGTIAGGGGGGGGGRWQRAGGGGGGAPYGLAGSGHYDWTSGGLCLPGELLVGGDGGRMGEGGRNGGRGGAWGMQGSWADANGTNVPPGNAGVALQGSNITVTNVGAGVVKGS